MSVSDAAVAVPLAREPPTAIAATPGTLASTGVMRSKMGPDIWTTQFPAPEYPTGRNSSRDVLLAPPPPVR